MSQLIKIKDFFRLNQAASYLSAELNEPIDIADIYQLALEDKIQLSVQFINPTLIHLTRKVSHPDAQEIIFNNRNKTLNLLKAFLQSIPDNAENDKAVIVDIINLCENDEEWSEVNGRYRVPPFNNGYLLFEELHNDLPLYRLFCSHFMSLNGYDLDKFVVFTDTTDVSVMGIHDIMLQGEGKKILERLYKDHINTDRTPSFDLHGLFVKNRKLYWDNSWTHFDIESPEEEDDVIFQVLTPSNDQVLMEEALMTLMENSNSKFVAGGVPSDAHIIIRSSELMRFTSELLEPLKKNDHATEEKKMNNKTKHSYLKLIYALSSFIADPLTGVKSKDSEIVMRALEIKGINIPIEERAIREYIYEGSVLS